MTMPASPYLSRRTLVGSGGALLMLMALVGCSTDQQREAEGEGQDQATKPREAPMLAAMVQAGDLPPVEERLPESPMVVEATDRPGEYGGTVYSALLNQYNVFQTRCAYENLVRWASPWTGAAGTEELTPNVVKSFDFSSDGKTITFELRPGMKWSDGEPFTADDIVFAAEDVFLNTDLYPVPPVWLTAGGEVATVEKIDDYSLSLTYPKPPGLLLQQLCHPNGSGLERMPFHYLKTFHKKYNPNVDELAKQEGANDWIGLFGSKSSHRAQSTIPTISPWRVVTPRGEGTQVVLERNPYYWKVDQDGSQLPYIDKFVFEMNVDAEAALLGVASGDYSLEIGPDHFVTTLQNKPFLAKNRDRGNYRFIDAKTIRMNVSDIQLNQTHKDPTKRAVLQNQDFRVGLSHAINRSEIVQAVLQRQGEPYQAAPLPDSAFFNEDFATQYLQYDPDLANEYLDKVLPEKNAGGMRLDPNGKPFSFKMTLVVQWNPEWSDIADLLRSYWNDVGIEMTYEARQHSYWQKRANVSDHDATMWLGDGGVNPFVALHHYAPVGSQSYYAMLWANWYRGVKPDEEPPEAPKQQMALYDQIKATIDSDEQTRLMKQILDISREQFYVIGVARETSGYYVASNQEGNLPKTMLAGWDYATPGPTQPEQYFIQQ